MTSENTLRCAENGSDDDLVLTLNLTPEDCQRLVQALALSVSALDAERPTPPFRFEEEIVEDLVAAWTLIGRLSIPVVDWSKRNVSE